MDSRITCRVTRELIFEEKEFKVWHRLIQYPELGYYDIEIEKPQYPSVFISVSSEPLIPNITGINYETIERLYREIRQFNYELHKSDTE